MIIHFDLDYFVRTILALCVVLITGLAIAQESKEISADIQSQAHTYIVQSGDTPQKLAREHYGNERYAFLLMLHNNLENRDDLPVGSSIRIPAFEELFPGEPLAGVMREEIDLVLEVRQLFMKQEGRLREIQNNIEEKEPDLPTGTKELIKTAADKLDIAMSGFATIKEGIVYEPRGLLSQLRMLRNEMRELAYGDVSLREFDLDRVHERIAVALAYGVVWSRHGFR